MYLLRVSIRDHRSANTMIDAKKRAIDRFPSSWIINACNTRIYPSLFRWRFIDSAALLWWVHLVSLSKWDQACASSKLWSWPISHLGWDFLSFWSCRLSLARWMFSLNGWLRRCQAKGSVLAHCLTQLTLTNETFAFLLLLRTKQRRKTIKWIFQVQ